MKNLVMVVIGTICLTSFANVATIANKGGVTKKPLTEAEKKERLEKRMMATGGICVKEGEGVVVVVNAQHKFSNEIINKRIDILKKMIKVNVELRDGSWRLGDKLPVGANIAMYLVDEQSLPMSLVAMEAKWGLMNVAQLDGDDRFAKEFARVAIATLGAGVSMYKGSPMQTVTKPEDLDMLMADTATFDAITSMNSHLENLGVSKYKMTSYRKACEEGWASEPTNKYQKAVWDQVHQLPTKPIGIQYDPAKDK